MKHKVLNIAHRGASGLYPENTRTAFIKAIEFGAEVIELDVNVTKDNQIVVIHDATINRTSDGQGKVRRMSLAELKKYNFGTEEKKEKILTLSEALKLIGNERKVIIELKSTVKGHEKEVMKIVQNRPKVWIHSSHLPILKTARTLNHSVRLGYVIIFSLFHRFMTLYYFLWAKKYHLTFFSVDEVSVNKYFTRSIIRKLKRAGLDIYVWVVNDIPAMREALSWKIDGIITNYPEVLKKVISGKASKPTVLNKKNL